MTITDFQDSEDAECSECSECDDLRDSPVRERAEAVLRELVGRRDARLREDQWRAIEALVERPEPLVAILWGRPAQSLTPLLGTTPVIASPHPSPLSASRGFFGSKPFSRANAELTRLGAQPVDWRLP